MYALSNPQLEEERRVLFLLLFHSIQTLLFIFSRFFFQIENRYRMVVHTRPAVAPILDRRSNCWYKKKQKGRDEEEEPGICLLYAHRFVVYCLGFVVCLPSIFLVQHSVTFQSLRYSLGLRSSFSYSLLFLFAVVNDVTQCQRQSTQSDTGRISPFLIVAINYADIRLQSWPLDAEIRPRKSESKSSLKLWRILL